MKNRIVRSLAVGLAFVVMTVHFGLNASALDHDAIRSLDTLVHEARLHPDHTIHLAGHTDDIGDDAHNEALSEQRVLAVKEHLVARGIARSRIDHTVHGEHDPVVPNTCDSSRALNRRVEVRMTLPTGSAAASDSTVMEPMEASVASTVKGPAGIPSVKEERKKKRWKRLVWTGWKTGFHWDTPGDRKKARPVR